MLQYEGADMDVAVCPSAKSGTKWSCLVWTSKICFNPTQEFESWVRLVTAFQTKGQRVYQRKKKTIRLYRVAS
jgi:hypothetical protein